MKAIFYNPAQPRGRAANSLAHELAHIVLEHEPEIALASDGNRNWNVVQEEEATWMAATVLVLGMGRTRG
ncbi:MAG: ImmA/IrrE family metallo-endopeptidase [Dehalococcoidia bacterium]|nr:ImmA/IrrE family metallo-endopeptidase [Dehalococcoidia bacterium]